MSGSSTPVNSCTNFLITQVKHLDPLACSSYFTSHTEPINNSLNKEQNVYKPPEVLSDYITIQNQKTEEYCLHYYSGKTCFKSSLVHTGVMFKVCTTYGHSCKAKRALDRYHRTFSLLAAIKSKPCKWPQGALLSSRPRLTLWSCWGSHEGH